MDDSDQELIDKGHGVRHYSCGHESRCRCKHGSNLHVNVDEPCWDCKNTSLDEKAPPGWKGTVKAMKKHKEIDNPFALAWSMKNRGDTPHYKDSKENPPEKKKRFQDWLKHKDALLYREHYSSEE